MLRTCLIALILTASSAAAYADNDRRSQHRHDGDRHELRHDARDHRAHHKAHHKAHQKAHRKAHRAHRHHVHHHRAPRVIFVPARSHYHVAPRRHHHGHHHHQSRDPSLSIRLNIPLD